MPSTIPTQPFVAFAAGSAPTLNQTAVMDWGVDVTTHSMVVTGTGTLTTGAIAMQGSHDNTNWAAMGTSITANTTVQSTTQANFPCRYVRAIATVAVTGGGTVTVTLAST